MQKLEDSQVQIQTCTFEGYFQKATINIKFPALFFVQWRTKNGKNSVVMADRKQAIDSVIQLDQTLSLTTEMIYHKINKSYLKKESLIHLNLISHSHPDRIKLVGRIPVDLADILNNKLYSVKSNNQLMYCSIQAQLAFQIKFVKMVKSSMNFSQFDQSSFTDFYNFEQLKKLSPPKTNERPLNQQLTAQDQKSFTFIQRNHRSFYESKNRQRSRQMKDILGQRVRGQNAQQSVTKQIPTKQIAIQSQSKKISRPYSSLSRGLNQQIKNQNLYQKQKLQQQLKQHKKRIKQLQEDLNQVRSMFRELTDKSQKQKHELMQSKRSIEELMSHQNSLKRSFEKQTQKLNQQYQNQIIQISQKHYQQVQNFKLEIQQYKMKIQDLLSIKSNHEDQKQTKEHSQELKMSILERNRIQKQLQVVKAENASLYNQKTLNHNEILRQTQLLSEIQHQNQQYKKNNLSIMQNLRQKKEEIVMLKAQLVQLTKRCQQAQIQLCVQTRGLQQQRIQYNNVIQQLADQINNNSFNYSENVFNFKNKLNTLMQLKIQKSVTLLQQQLNQLKIYLQNIGEKNRYLQSAILQKQSQEKDLINNQTRLIQANTQHELQKQDFVSNINVKDGMQDVNYAINVNYASSQSQSFSGQKDTQIRKNKLDDMFPNQSIQSIQIQENKIQFQYVNQKDEANNVIEQIQMAKKRIAQLQQEKIQIIMNQLSYDKKKDQIVQKNRQKIIFLEQQLKQKESQLSKLNQLLESYVQKLSQLLKKMNQFQTQTARQKQQTSLDFDNLQKKLASVLADLSIKDDLLNELSQKVQENYAVKYELADYKQKYEDLTQFVDKGQQYISRLQKNQIVKKQKLQRQTQTSRSVYQICSSIFLKIQSERLKKQTATQHIAQKHLFQSSTQTFDCFCKPHPLNFFHIQTETLKNVKQIQTQTQIISCKLSSLIFYHIQSEISAKDLESQAQLQKTKKQLNQSYLQLSNVRSDNQELNQKIILFEKEQQKLNSQLIKMCSEKVKLQNIISQYQINLKQRKLSKNFENTENQNNQLSQQLAEQQQKIENMIKQKQQLQKQLSCYRQKSQSDIDEKIKLLQQIAFYRQKISKNQQQLAKKTQQKQISSRKMIQIQSQISKLVQQMQKLKLRESQNKQSNKQQINLLKNQLQNIKQQLLMQQKLYKQLQLLHQNCVKKQQIINNRLQSCRQQIRYQEQQYNRLKQYNSIARQQLDQSKLRVLQLQTSLKRFQQINANQNMHKHNFNQNLQAKKQFNKLGTIRKQLLKNKIIKNRIDIIQQKIMQQSIVHILHTESEEELINQHKLKNQEFETTTLINKLSQIIEQASKMILLVKQSKGKSQKESLQIIYKIKTIYEFSISLYQKLNQNTFQITLLKEHLISSQQILVYEQNQLASSKEQKFQSKSSQVQQKNIKKQTEKSQNCIYNNEQRDIDSQTSIMNRKITVLSKQILQKDAQLNRLNSLKTQFSSTQQIALIILNQIQKIKIQINQMCKQIKGKTSVSMIAQACQAAVKQLITVSQLNDSYFCPQ